MQCEQEAEKCLKVVCFQYLWMSIFCVSTMFNISSFSNFVYNDDILRSKDCCYIVAVYDILFMYTNEKNSY